MQDLFDILPRANVHGFVIDANVPLPENRVAGQRVQWDGLKDKLPFKALRVGDSFAINPAFFETDTLRLQNYISGAACSYRKTQPPGTWDFTTRQMPDGRVRCWRINPEDHKGRGQ